MTDALRPGEARDIVDRLEAENVDLYGAGAAGRGAAADDLGAGLEPPD